MKTTRLALLIVAGAAGLISGQILADQDVRHVPERDIPVPATVSPATQAVIARPLSPIWNEHPKSAEEWKVLIARLADGVVATLPELRQRLGVKVEPTVIGGVKAYVVTPESIPETNRNRLLVHVHGGGYVFFPGEAGTREAILMAGYSGMKVISVDYRMPPDFPYPAALDDAMAVWKEVVKTTNPKNIAIFGTSTGGGMTLAMVLRAEKEGLPLPAATAPGTPWSDMTKTGDTYFSNEMVDNVLVSNDGWLGDAAKLYANGKHRRRKALQRPSRAGKRRVVLAKLRFEPETYTRLVANFDHAAQWLIESGSHSANYRIFGFVGKVGRVEIGEVAILDPIVERANG